MSSALFRKNLKDIDWSVKMERPKNKVEEHENMRSHLAAPRVIGDYEAYECPVTGKMIEGRAAHNENLKRTGCRILERGEKEENTKNGKQRMFDQIDAAVDKCVDEVARDFL